LAGGLAAWRAAGLGTAAIAQEPAESAVASGRLVLDVRRPGEWSDFHAAGAHHVPLADLAQRVGGLPRDRDLVVVCASGYRSSIATSVLERAGFTRLVNAVGGMEAYRRSGLPLARSG
jgi:hydroxyacylglutathione hydrolase